LKQLLIFISCIWFSTVLQAHTSNLQIPDFSGLTRRYLVSLSPSDVNFIFSDITSGAQPNYNWSLAYGYSPICTMDEVEKIRNAMGAELFSKYGELLNFGWLYDQREFESPLRKFQIILKKDKSHDARIIQYVVERSLNPASIAQQKRLIENEIERNEKRLSERSGLSREKSAALAKSFSRRFKNCLGRYQTGYINLATQLNNY